MYYLLVSALSAQLGLNRRLRDEEYMREGRDIVKMRWWCMRKHEQGWSGNKIAAHLQVPRRTVYDWINRYAGCNKEEMANKPNKVAIEVDDCTRKFVLRLRERHDWGPCRIERYIRKVKPNGIQPIGHCSIYTIFVEEGVNQPINFIRKTWGKRRFERMHSYEGRLNDLHSCFHLLCLYPFMTRTAFSY